MTKDYMDTSLSPSERALRLLKQMTLEEKIGQMMQISSSRVTEEEGDAWASSRFAGSFLHTLGDRARHLQTLAKKTRLGIPILFGIDAIHGHAIHNGATIFPSQLAMSCSWDEALIEQAGRVTAREVAGEGLHWTFSPVLCIARDTRWGRVDETFGEDPYLIGILASAIIRGYQGDKLSDPDSILACAKHYLAYGESTGGRDSTDAQVSLRRVREVFLPPFKKAVEAGCATFMTGYQSIDGTPMTASKKLLKDILKEELGFNGFVVTDWDNLRHMLALQQVTGNLEESSKKAVEAGNDMIMVTLEFYEAALSLVRRDLLSESVIDEAVKRILTIKFSMGLFDGKAEMPPADESLYANAEHSRINLELARQSMVLLKNENETLPFGKNVRKIAVIGPNADAIDSQMGDWTFFTHPDPVPGTVFTGHGHTMLSGIRTLASSRGVEVLYHKGCDIMNPEDQDIPGALDAARQADVVVAVVGDCIAQNGEGKDRADLNLSGAQQELLIQLKATGKPLVVLLVNGKPLSLPWVAKNADAVLETFNSGSLGGLAAAEILFGEANPCGKLSISFPHHVGQLPVYYNQLPGWHGDIKYMDMPKDPVYSFGYGLSYTTFAYTNLTLSKDVCDPDETIMVSVDVTNTGDRDGAEVVQLYVRDRVSSYVTPVKQLKGFKKVFLTKGETRTVTIPLAMTDLAVVTQEETYVVEPGDFTIMTGSSSRDGDLLTTSLTVR